jgi:hypothetical protein
MRVSGSRRVVEIDIVRTEPSVLGVRAEPFQMLCPTDSDLPSKVERALNRGKSP